MSQLVCFISIEIVFQRYFEVCILLTLPKLKFRLTIFEHYTKFCSHITISDICVFPLLAQLIFFMVAGIRQNKKANDYYEFGLQVIGIPAICNHL